MALTYYTPRPANMDSQVAFDVRGLDRLRKQVGEQGGAQDEQNREVARQFEALFLQMMIKRMREATPRDGLFESDQTRMAQSLADEQLAMQLATPGIGLAQALLDQIQAQQGRPAPGEPGAGSRTAPELSPSRVPGLRSRTAAEAMQDAPSVPPAVAALLDVLAGRDVASARKLAAAEGAPDHVVEFVSRMAGPAQHAAEQSGVPARLILGQAALESGWGRREIVHKDGSPSYNVFGIKATSGWKGRVVEVMTTEYENGVARKTVQPFRAYGSYAEAFADYARLLGSSPRYEQVLQARDEIDAARRVQAAGYATDPNYADKLIDVMSQFDKAPASARGKYIVSSR